MSGLYEDFEKRFTNAWFAAGWVEVDTKPKEAAAQTTNEFHKDLSTLQKELDDIKAQIENISQKQLRLANLAKFYSN